MARFKTGVATISEVGKTSSLPTTFRPLVVLGGPRFGFSTTIASDSSVDASTVFLARRPFGFIGSVSSAVSDAVSSESFRVCRPVGLTDASTSRKNILLCSYM